MRPVIGVTTQTLQAIDGIPPQLPHSVVMNDRYYTAVAQAGGAPVLVPLLDEDFDDGNVLDFPNAIANSTTMTGLALNFQMIDSAGTASFAATKTTFFGAYWGVFTVVPEPTTLVLLLLGGLVGFRRVRG